MRALDRNHFDSLFAALKERGYTVVGPTVRDGAIVYDEIPGAADLPHGWTERQGAGTYRLERRYDDALFGFAAGPHSWKRYLFPPVVRLFRAERGDRETGRRSAIHPEVHEATRYAFLGVRACDLAALGIQDRVFLGGPHRDALYSTRRQDAFIVAVQCAEAGGTCFCASMDAGPRVEKGFDLALTEILGPEGHCFTIAAGSPRGEEVLAQLPTREATPDEIAAAEEAPERAAAGMGRQLDTTGLRDLLRRNYESRRWNQLAERCLACSNCTMVCPTCFCSTVEDTADLTGTTAERWRKWDSCFTVDFSYLHGGSVRSSIASRYRQWITHKLASWIDQFGTSGCVGCGRCIAWCPAGIDITEEVRALRADDSGAPVTQGGEAS
jgi:ferredoxin